MKYIARLACAALALLLLVSMPASADQQRWAVNFKDTDIRDFISFVGDATGKTFVVDPQVHGKVQVTSRQKLTASQLYGLFLSILEVHGYAAIRQANGVVRIVDQKNARTQGMPVTDTADSKPPPHEPGGEAETRVIHLSNIDATRLAAVIRPLVPQQAHLAAYAPSNSIIISDTAANIDRIQKVVADIDASAVSASEAIHLKHANADDVVRLIKALDKHKAGGADAESGAKLIADTRTNSIVVEGDELQRQRIHLLVRYLDQPQTNSGNARVVYLEYANAKDVAKVLGKVVQNIARFQSGKATAGQRSSDAVIEADEATNSLIITADPQLMQTLDAVIAKLDIRRAQVLVEAIIVEIRDSNSKDLGIEWLFSNRNGLYGSSANPPSGGIGVLGATSSALLNGSTGGLTTAESATPGGLLGLGKLGRSGLNFNVLIKALEDNSKADILSTPSLLTLDNNPAQITVGQEVPFITGQYTSTGSGSNPTNPFQTIERKDVGITLSVTPHINEGNSIVLDLKQEVSSLTNQTASDIITNKREISTTVLANNGEVVVLGGLIENDLQQTERKVPILGSIPLLGRLFRSNTTQLKKTNLLVFLRPLIIRDQQLLAGATAEKYNDMRNDQLRDRQRGVALMNDNVVPLLPKWKQQLEELRDLRNKGQNSRQTPQTDKAAPKQQAAPKAAGATAP